MAVQLGKPLDIRLNVAWRSNYAGMHLPAYKSLNAYYSDLESSLYAPLRAVLRDGLSSALLNTLHTGPFAGALWDALHV